MNRRQLLVAGLAGAAASGLSACNGTAVQASRSATPDALSGAAAVIGLTYIPNIQFSPFYWAEDKQLFAKHEVSAKLRHHGADEGLFTAISAGSEHFVVAGGDEMVQACSEGLDLVAVATLYQDHPVRVIVPETSGIKQLSDLKGHTVGVPGRYGENWFGLLLALRTAGLSESDIKVQVIGYTAQAALATGKVDAVVGYSNNDAVQFRANKVAVRELELAPEVPLVGVSLITTRKYLAAQPGLVKGIAKAFVEAARGVVEDPAEAVRTSIAHVPGLEGDDAQKAARATLDASIPLITAGKQVDGRIDLTKWKRMCEFMAENKLVGKVMDASTMVDTTILG